VQHLQEVIVSFGCGIGFFVLAVVVIKGHASRRSATSRAASSSVALE
jgi:hypothetical protein